jgi:hypothetical protein
MSCTSHSPSLTIATQTLLLGLLRETAKGYLVISLQGRHRQTAHSHTPPREQPRGQYFKELTSCQNTRIIEDKFAVYTWILVQQNTSAKCQKRWRGRMSNEASCTVWRAVEVPDSVEWSVWRSGRFTLPPIPSTQMPKGSHNYKLQLSVLFNHNGILILILMLSLLLKKSKKQSHNRPGQALTVPGGWGSQIYRQSAHEGGKVVSPKHRPPLPPRKDSWYSFLLEAESTPGPQCNRNDYVKELIPKTPSGIEPATFRFVAQCLNQLRHRVVAFLLGILTREDGTDTLSRNVGK